MADLAYQFPPITEEALVGWAELLQANHPHEIQLQIRVTEEVAALSVEILQLSFSMDVRADV